MRLIQIDYHLGYIVSSYYLSLFGAEFGGRQYLWLLR
jgi:hypothetical protein